MTHNHAYFEYYLDFLLHFIKLDGCILCLHNKNEEEYPYVNI